MKKIIVIFTSLYLFYSIDIFSQENKPKNQFNGINLDQISIAESVTFVKKNALFITTIPMVFYFNQNLFKQISEHPYISSIYFYILINYICDSISEYQQQESLINLVVLLKRIALYLAISHGIKNSLTQQRESAESISKKEYIFNVITKKWPYSCNKMTAIVLESYHNIKKNLYKLNHSVTVESEEFVFLHHAPSITIDDLLYLTEHDERLHSMILSFEKNSELEFEPLLEHLTLEIMFNFLALEQNIINIQTTSISQQSAL